MSKCIAGLPARRDVVEALRAQQLGALRMGGTMCNVDGYRWRAPSSSMLLMRRALTSHNHRLQEVLPWSQGGARPLPRLLVRRSGVDAVAQLRHLRDCGPQPGKCSSNALCLSQQHACDQFLRMRAQAIECEPIITLNLNETPSDMAGVCSDTAQPCMRSRCIARP